MTTENTARFRAAVEALRSSGMSPSPRLDKSIDVSGGFLREVGRNEPLAAINLWCSSIPQGIAVGAAFRKQRFEVFSNGLSVVRVFLQRRDAS